MRWIMAIVALALAVVSPAAHAVPSTTSNQGSASPPPSSASSTEAQISGLAQWNGELEHLLVTMMAPFQTESMPPPPAEDMDDTARRQWAANARVWAQQSQAGFAALQIELNQMPASPPSDAPITPELRAALEAVRASLPEALSRANDIVQSYGPMADAFEHHQNGVVRQFRVRAIDSSLLTLKLFHDANISQATVLPPSSPQGALLMSYARSYEGFSALLTFKRQVMVTGERDQAAANVAATALNASEQQIRALVDSGRGATHAMQQQYSDPSRYRPEDAPLIGRVTGVLGTYDGSFDRELHIADEAHAMAVLLVDTRDFGVVEPEIDDHMTRFGELDGQRMIDAQRRQQIMAGH